MDRRFFPYAEHKAPRYTSYPTALRFTDAVDGDVYEDWLRAIPADEGLSLYIHVPYCRDLCWYCGCHAYATHRNETLDHYAASLMREIELAASAAGTSRVVAIRWGGGTPNILSLELFARLFRHLKFWIDLEGLETHAIEIDPRYLTREQAALYASLGVTRGSVGVQEFSARVQAAIGRRQPFAKVVEAVTMLRETGIPRIGMDLMYGLPHQTAGDVRRAARVVAALAPDSVAVFGYAHAPWFKSRQKLIDADALPDGRQRMEQEAAARAELLAAGYEPVGLDHYAKPNDDLAIAARAGELHRNFHGYVTDDRAVALIGLGASAISTLPQGYAQNAAEIGAWRKAIASDRFATARGRELNEDDRRRGRLIESLLCRFAVDLRDFGGRQAFAAELDELKPFVRDGLAALDGEMLTIPEDARPLARVTAALFDAYRDKGETRYSRVI